MLSRQLNTVQALLKEVGASVFVLPCCQNAVSFVILRFCHPQKNGGIPIPTWDKPLASSGIGRCKQQGVGPCSEVAFPPKTNHWDPGGPY